MHPGRLVRMAVTVFFDYTAAIPGVDHEFLFMTTERCGIPAGAAGFLRSIYIASTFLVLGDAEPEAITRMTSGVLHGSPLSGLLFVLAMDWVLEQFCGALEPVAGLVRACINNVGAVLQSVDHLSLAAPVSRSRFQFEWLRCSTTLVHCCCSPASRCSLPLPWPGSWRKSGASSIGCSTSWGLTWAMRRRTARRESVTSRPPYARQAQGPRDSSSRARGPSCSEMQEAVEHMACLFHRSGRRGGILKRWQRLRFEARLACSGVDARGLRAKRHAQGVMEVRLAAEVHMRWVFEASAKSIARWWPQVARTVLVSEFRGLLTLATALRLHTVLD